MKSIAFINQKGGVGKTTSTINIGAGLARLGKKVLLVDFDPQANLTAAFGVQNEQIKQSVYTLLQDAVQNKLQDTIDYIQLEKNLYLLPGDLALSGLESEYMQHSGKEFLFKQCSASIKEFDYMLVDCPPSLGLLTLNVLAAVDFVYIPVQTEFFALQGLGQILTVIEVVNQTLNPRLTLGGIIGTRSNKRKLHKDVLHYLQEHFQGAVLTTVIRENIALAEAPSFGKDIYQYSPRSYGAKDYQALCKEIVKQQGDQA